MCRRFALRGHHHDGWLRYAPPWKRASRYNIAPTDWVLCLTRIDHGLYPKFRSLRWGYPVGDRANKSGYVITIRTATMLRRTWSRDMLRERRCLIPADGFYVWSNSRDHDPGQPHFIRQPDDHPFYFAALWMSDGENHFCFILTTTTARRDHLPKRMPVILHANYHESWLDPRNRDVYDLDSMLAKGRAPELESYPVGPFVNHPDSEGKDCIQPVGPSHRGAALSEPGTLDRRRINRAWPQLIT